PGLPRLALGGVAHEDADGLPGGEQRGGGDGTGVSRDSSDDVHDELLEVARAVRAVSMPPACVRTAHASNRLSSYSVFPRFMAVRLAGIDLNLLTTLDALLATQSVTRAARQLGRTQPAISHALRRLRELLGDELLVRTPGGMRPTPRAHELRPAVRAALEAAEAVLQEAPAFDPARAQRAFAVSMADQASFLLLPPLAARLAREAPGVRIDVRPGPQFTLV